MTPLFGAVVQKNLKAIDLLIKHKGDPHLKNFHGHSVICDHVADDEVLAYLCINHMGQTFINICDHSKVNFYFYN